MNWILSLLLVSSCSFLIKDQSPESAKGKRYTLSFQASGWALKDSDRSDYIFEHKDGGILLSNSFCDEFQEDPLKDLAKKTFKTVSHFKANRSDYTTFKNREAYTIYGEGEVDGVKVRLKLLNTRRDNCYFDFVSIIPSKVKGLDSTFETFLEGVSFK